MKISTKGRYALQVMVEFADHADEILSLKSVADLHQISLKYLEQIVQKLVKAELLTSFRGANGGYKLAKRPAEITVASILNATEGSLSVVTCMEQNSCGGNCHCRVRKCWDKLNGLIDDYLQNISLAELLAN
ncbi:MAG: Rrf2 family transcriptional regulator [Clostridia bacterium]|nr:Rrf2 family transcriptional regulator [Clostridia bacterium]